MQRNSVGFFQVLGGRDAQQDALSHGQANHFDRLSMAEQDHVVLQTYQQCEAQLEHEDYLGGSTAVSLMAWINENHEHKKILTVHSASLGDSRGFLLVLDAKHQVKVLQRVNPRLHSILTEHAYHNFEERLLTVRRGGQFSTVFRESEDCVRLCDVSGRPGLNMTGAFNDVEIPGLSHEPYLSHYEFPISLGDTVYLFAASDGLTDGITDLSKPEQIGIERFIEGIKKGDSLTTLAQSMVTLAEERFDGQGDNISLVIGQVIEDQPPLFIAAYDGHGEGGETVSSMLAANMLSCLQHVIKDCLKQRRQLLRSVLDNKDTHEHPAAKLYDLIPVTKAQQVLWAQHMFRECFDEKKQQAPSIDMQKNYWSFMNTCMLMKSQPSKRAMQRVLIDQLGKCETLFSMNRLYVQLKQLPVLNAHRYASIDRLLHIENTRSWQRCLQAIRLLAKERLQNEQTVLCVRQDRVLLLNRARKMPIFTDHRSNWFTFWGSGSTQAVKDIDVLLSENQQRLRR